MSKIHNPYAIPLLLLAFSAPAVSASTIPVPGASIHNISYDQARAKVLELGWQPYISTIDANDLEAKRLKDMGFVEVRSCSGSGLLACQFVFSDGEGTAFVITGLGEGIPRVSPQGAIYSPDAVDNPMGVESISSVTAVSSEPAQQSWTPSEIIRKHCEKTANVYQVVAQMRDQGVEPGAVFEAVDSKVRSQEDKDTVNVGVLVAYQLHPNIPASRFKEFWYQQCLNDNREGDIEHQAEITEKIKESVPLTQDNMSGAWRCKYSKGRAGVKNVTYNKNGSFIKEENGSKFLGTYEIQKSAGSLLLLRTHKPLESTVNHHITSHEIAGSKISIELDTSTTNILNSDGTLTIDNSDGTASCVRT